MYMVEETLKSLLRERKWKEFLEALPDDGVSRKFSVRDPNDLMNIRVRASQMKTDGRFYGVAVDFVDSEITIIVNKSLRERSGNTSGPDSPRPGED